MRMVVLDKEVVDIFLHGQAASSVGVIFRIVPLDVDASKCIAVPISCDGVCSVLVTHVGDVAHVDLRHIRCRSHQR